jgi:DNA-binding NarL/FixJ family response regulator
VAYAARHPERVSQMVLMNGFATSWLSTSKQDPKVVKEAETLLKLVELGWGSDSRAFRQVFASRCFPDADAELLRAFDELRRNASPDVAVRYLQASMSIDVRDLAAKVRCPTLVLHTKGNQMIHFAQGRRLAALIPGARFVPLESNNNMLLQGEAAWAPFVMAVRDFMGVPAATRAEHPVLTPRQLESLRGVAGGKTDKQIARELSVSPRTIEMHVAGALKALGCKTRAEAAHRAAQLRLFAPYNSTG